MEETSTKKPRSEKRRRTYALFLRLSDEERTHLEQQAAIVNRRPADFLRKLLTGSRLKPVAVYPPEVMRAIVGLGRNWNQLVRKVHATSSLDREDTQAMLKQIKDLWLCLLSRSTPDDPAQR